VKSRWEGDKFWREKEEEGYRKDQSWEEGDRAWDVRRRRAVVVVVVVDPSRLSPWGDMGVI